MKLSQKDDSYIDWNKPCFRKQKYGHDTDDVRSFVVYPSDAEVQVKAQKYFGKDIIEVSDTEASSQSFDFNASIRRNGNDIGYLDFYLDTNTCEWHIGGFESHE